MIVVRHRLNVMTPLLKSTPADKMQTAVALKYFFFRNQNVILECCQSEHSRLFLCKCVKSIEFFRLP